MKKWISRWLGRDIVVAAPPIFSYKFSKFDFQKYIPFRYKMTRSQRNSKIELNEIPGVKAVGSWS